MDRCVGTLGRGHKINRRLGGSGSVQVVSWEWKWTAAPALKQPRLTTAKLFNTLQVSLSDQSIMNNVHMSENHIHASINTM